MKTVRDVMDMVKLIRVKIKELGEPDAAIDRDVIIELLEDYELTLLDLPIKR